MWQHFTFVIYLIIKGEINVIKFKYAIHKQTKTVIPYETFLEYYRNNTDMFLSNQSFSERMKAMTKIETYLYRPIDILTSDDFEIIYDDILTYYEIGDILWKTELKEENEQLFTKLRDKSEKMLSLMYMYDIKL